MNAFEQGREAGRTRGDNPHPHDSDDHFDWECGYHEGLRERPLRRAGEPPQAQMAQGPVSLRIGSQ